MSSQYLSDTNYVNMLMSKQDYVSFAHDWINDVYPGLRKNNETHIFWRNSIQKSGQQSRGILSRKFEPWSEDMNLFFLRIMVHSSEILK